MHLERLEIWSLLHIYHNGFFSKEPAITISTHQSERERESIVRKDPMTPQIDVFENCINIYALGFT